MTTQYESDEKTYEELEDIRPQSELPLSLVLVSFLLLFGFSFVGAVFGLCDLGLGARATGWGRFLLVGIFFAVCWVGVYAFLVWPITNWIYPVYGKRWNKVVRLAVVTFLLSLPLISFSNFLASSPGLIDLHELIMMVVPSGLIAALLYESSGRSGVFSLYLAAATFIPLFVLNDQLGPFVPLFQYSAKSSSFYILRNFFPIVSILLVTWFCSSHPDPVDGLTNFIAVSIGLAVLSLVLAYVAPLLSQFFVKTEKEVVFSSDLSWLVYPFVILFLVWRKPVFYYILFILALMMLLWTLGWLVHYLGQMEASAWKLSWFSYYLFSLSAFSWFLFLLSKKTTRNLFRNVAD